MRGSAQQALLWLALAAAPSALLAQKAKSVTVAVTDERGEAFTEFDDCSLKSVFAGDYSKTSKRCSFRSVPYGLHVLTVYAAGFRSHEQTITIYQPQVYARVTLPVGEVADYDRLPGSPPFGTTRDDDLIVARTRLRGRYQAPRAVKSHMVRLVPLFGNGGRVQDAQLEMDGTFEVSGMTAGNYYLLIIADEPLSSPNVVLTRPVTIPMFGIVDVGNISADSGR